MAEIRSHSERTLGLKQAASSDFTSVDLAKRLYTVLGIPEDKPISDESCIDLQLIRGIFSKIFAVDFTDTTSTAAEARTMVRYLSDTVLNCDLDHIISSDIVTGIDGGLAKRFILELLWEIAVAVSAQSHSENSGEYSSAEQPRPSLEYSQRDSTTNKPSIDRNTQTQKENQKQWAGSTNVQNDIDYELVGDEPGARQSMTPHAARSGVTPFSKGQVATEPWQQVPISGRFNTRYPTALGSCEQEFTPIGHSYTPQGAYNSSSLRSRLLFQDGEGEGEGDGDRLGQDENIYGRSVWAGVLDRDIDGERGVSGVLPAGERAFYRTSSEQIGARGGYDHHNDNYQSMSHYRAGADGNVESIIDGCIGHVDNDLGLDMTRLRLDSAHETINTDVDTRLHTLPRSRFSTHTRSGAYATPYQTTHGETADAESQLLAENRLGYNHMDRLNSTASNNEYHHQRNANRFRYNIYNGHGGLASANNLLQLYGDGYDYGHEHHDRNLQSHDELYENQFAATQRRRQQQQARDMKSAMQSMRLDSVNQHRGEKEPVDTGIYGPGLNGLQQTGDEDYDARCSGGNNKPRVDTKRTDEDGYESGISHLEEAEHLRREIKRMQENIACLGKSRQAA